MRRGPRRGIWEGKKPPPPDPDPYSYGSAASASTIAKKGYNSKEWNGPSDYTWNSGYGDSMLHIRTTDGGFVVANNWMYFVNGDYSVANSHPYFVKFASDGSISWKVALTNLINCSIFYIRPLSNGGIIANIFKTSDSTIRLVVIASDGTVTTGAEYLTSHSVIEIVPLSGGKSLAWGNNAASEVELTLIGSDGLMTTWKTPNPGINTNPILLAKDRSGNRVLAVENGESNNYSGKLYVVSTDLSAVVDTVSWNVTISHTLDSVCGRTSDSGFYLKSHNNSTSRATISRCTSAGVKQWEKTLPITDVTWFYGQLIPGNGNNFWWWNSVNPTTMSARLIEFDDTGAPLKHFTITSSSGHNAGEFIKVVSTASGEYVYLSYGENYGPTIFAFPTSWTGTHTVTLPYWGTLTVTAQTVPSTTTTAIHTYSSATDPSLSTPTAPTRTSETVTTDTTLEGALTLQTYTWA